MLLFHRFASLLVGHREVLVPFQEPHLQFVPLPFGLQHAIVHHLFEERRADQLEIPAAQIIQIGIAEYPGELVPRRLRDLGGQDHLTDQLDVVLGEPELRKFLADDAAARLLVVPVLLGESGIVVQGRYFQKNEPFSGNAFLLGNVHGTGIHVQRMRQRMVGPFRRKLGLELGQNIRARSLWVHGLGGQDTHLLHWALYLYGMHRTSRRTYVLFGALTLYVLLQFVWWAVLLVRKESEMAQLAMQVQMLGGTTDHPLDASRAMRMIVGEGLVFFFLLLGVLYLTFRAIKRDLGLARTQRNFLMAVTHELRTPIAAIKLQLQTLARKGLGDEQREMLRSQALLEADRLNVLAEKVLLATSAEEGVLALDMNEVDVMELLRSVVDRARVQIAPHHALLLNGPDTFRVLSDAQALRSIADNLIENAAKYSPQGSRITLEVVKGADGWRMSVSDEGPGIPVPEQARVFEKFFRGGNEETRKAKGTGLGLYIVQRLAQRLGGAVHYRQGTPSGAIFAASFPDR